MAADAGALFAADHHRLFKYFCRAVGQTETARDLTQDVFLRVSRTAIPAAADGELKAWLFQIARNLVLDQQEPEIDPRRQPRPAHRVGIEPGTLAFCEIVEPVIAQQLI